MLTVAVSLGSDAGHTAPTLNPEKTRVSLVSCLFVCFASTLIWVLVKGKRVKPLVKGKTTG